MDARAFRRSMTILPPSSFVENRVQRNMLVVFHTLSGASGRKLKRLVHQLTVLKFEVCHEVDHSLLDDVCLVGSREQNSCDVITIYCTSEVLFHIHGTIRMIFLSLKARCGAHVDTHGPLFAASLWLISCPPRLTLVARE